MRDIPFAVYEVAARLLLPDGAERMLRVASGPPDASPDGVNRTFRWLPSAIVDFVAAGPAIVEHSAGQQSGEVRLHLSEAQ